MAAVNYIKKPKQCAKKHILTMSLLRFDKGTKGKYAKDEVTDLSAKQTMV